MIFVDSNVPMYIRGRAHPNKATAKYLLERAAVNRERLVTDAEVLQEIIHRYSALNRREDIDPTLRYVLEVVDEVFPVEKRDALRASQLVRDRARISARDAVHLAIMERHRVPRVLSFDSDFDGWPGITRIHSV